MGLTAREGLTKSVTVRSGGVGVTVEDAGAGRCGTLKAQIRVIRQ